MNQEEAASHAQNRFAEIFGDWAHVVAAWSGFLGGWLVRVADEDGATWTIFVDLNGTVTINPDAE